jgi:hypothetical protein
MKIVSIKKIRKFARSYDIEVEKNHNFFANKVLVHNSSMTLYHRNGHYGVCSRNQEVLRYERKNYTGLRKVWANFIADLFNLKEPGESKENKFLSMSDKLDIKDSLRSFGNIALQGELIGPDIQKNKYGLKVPEYRVFNIWMIDERKYLDVREMMDICHHLGILTVPILNDNLVLNHTIDELVKRSKGYSVLAKVKREGIVLRPYEDCNVGSCGMVSFKCINPEFLLEHGE